jgi:hypothetical protein
MKSLRILAIAIASGFNVSCSSSSEARAIFVQVPLMARAQPFATPKALRGFGVIGDQQSRVGRGC